MLFFPQKGFVFLQILLKQYIKHLYFILNCKMFASLNTSASCITLSARSLLSCWLAQIQVLYEPITFLKCRNKLKHHTCAFSIKLQLNNNVFNNNMFKYIHFYSYLYFCWPLSHILAACVDFAWNEHTIKCAISGTKVRTFYGNKHYFVLTKIFGQKICIYSIV